MRNTNFYFSSNNKDDLLFDNVEPEEQIRKYSGDNNKAIKLLIVDDDDDIHQVTHMVLDDFQYRNNHLDILDAFSANHAKQILEKHPDIAVVLLDVVMETDQAGLEFVNYIRNVLENPYIRIILRTGQPGHAPELQVVQNYDINDYRDKSELTAGKLISSVTAAIRSYQDIRTIETMAHEVTNLEKVVSERTTELQRLNKQLEKRVSDRTRELEIAKEKAEQASQAKTQFLSRVSHELRTPMNAILGFSQLLEMNKDANLNEEQAEYVAEILKGGHHLLSLINELLDITRIERGQIKLNNETFSVKQIFSETIPLIQPLLDEKSVQISNQVCLDKDITIQTDKTRFKQVLLNLISNAAKYNHDSGSITLNCTSDNQNLLISIKDTGIGIPQDKVDSIFMPFIRVDPYSPVDGSGIGLAVCKQIVEAMGGEIGVESMNGLGSRFWFSIPIQQV